MAGGIFLEECLHGRLIPVLGGAYAHHLSMQHKVDELGLARAIAQNLVGTVVRLYVPVGGETVTAAYLDRFRGEDREELLLVPLRAGVGADDEAVLVALVEATQRPVRLPAGMASARGTGVNAYGVRVPDALAVERWLVPLAMEAAQEALRSLMANGAPVGSPDGLDRWLAVVGSVRDRLGVSWSRAGSPRSWSVSMVYALGMYVARFGVPAGFDLGTAVDSVVGPRSSDLVGLLGGPGQIVTVDALGDWLVRDSAVGGGALVRTGEDQLVWVWREAGVRGSARVVRPWLEAPAADVRLSGPGLAGKLRELLGDASMRAWGVDGSGGLVRIVAGPGLPGSVRASAATPVRAVGSGLERPLAGPAPIAAAGLPAGAGRLEAAGSPTPTGARKRVDLADFAVRVQARVGPSPGDDEGACIVAMNAARDEWFEDLPLRSAGPWTNDEALRPGLWSQWGDPSSWPVWDGRWAAIGEALEGHVRRVAFVLVGRMTQRGHAGWMAVAQPDGVEWVDVTRDAVLTHAELLAQVATGGLEFGYEVRAKLFDPDRREVLPSAEPGLDRMPSTMDMLDTAHPGYDGTGPEEELKNYVLVGLPEQAGVGRQTLLARDKQGRYHLEVELIDGFLGSVSGRRAVFSTQEQARHAGGGEAVPLPILERIGGIGRSHVHEIFRAPIDEIYAVFEEQSVRINRLVTGQPGALNEGVLLTQLLAGLGLTFTEIGRQVALAPGPIGAVRGVDQQYTEGVGYPGLGLYLALITPLPYLKTETGYRNQENLRGSVGLAWRYAEIFRGEVSQGERNLAEGESADISTALVLTHLAWLIHHTFAIAYHRTTAGANRKIHLAHMSREDFDRLRSTLPESVQDFLYDHADAVWNSFEQFFHNIVPAEGFADLLYSAAEDRARLLKIEVGSPGNSLRTLAIGYGTDPEGNRVPAILADYLKTGLVSDLPVRVGQVDAFGELSTVSEPDYADGTRMTRAVVGETRGIDEPAIEVAAGRERNYSLTRIANLEYDRALVIPAAERMRRAQLWHSGKSQPRDLGVVSLNHPENATGFGLPWLRYLDDQSVEVGRSLWLSVDESTIEAEHDPMSDGEGEVVEHIQTLADDQLAELTERLSQAGPAGSNALFIFGAYRDELVELRARYGFSMVFAPKGASISVTFDGALESSRGWRLVAFDNYVDDSLGTVLNRSALSKAVKAIDRQATRILDGEAGSNRPADYRDQQGKLWRWTERYGFVQEPDPDRQVTGQQLIITARDLVTHTDKRAFPPRWTGGDARSVGRLEQYQADVEPAPTARPSPAGSVLRQLGALMALFGHELGVASGRLGDLSGFADVDLIQLIGAHPRPIVDPLEVIVQLAQRRGYVALFRAPAGEGQEPHVFGLLNDDRSPLRVQLRWLDSRFTGLFAEPLDPQLYTTREPTIPELLAEHQLGPMFRMALTPAVNALGLGALKPVEPMLLEALGLPSPLPVDPTTRPAPADAMRALRDLATHDWHVSRLLSPGTELIGVLTTAGVLDPTFLASTPPVPPVIVVGAGLPAGAPAGPVVSRGDFDSHVPAVGVGDPGSFAAQVKERAGPDTGEGYCVKVLEAARDIWSGGPLLTNRRAADGALLATDDSTLRPDRWSQWGVPTSWPLWRGGWDAIGEAVGRAPGQVAFVLMGRMQRRGHAGWMAVSRLAGVEWADLTTGMVLSHAQLRAAVNAGVIEPGYELRAKLFDANRREVPIEPNLTTTRETAEVDQLDTAYPGYDGTGPEQELAGKRVIFPPGTAIARKRELARDGQDRYRLELEGFNTYFGIQQGQPAVFADQAQARESGGTGAFHLSSIIERVGGIGRSHVHEIYRIALDEVYELFREQSARMQGRAVGTPGTDEGAVPLPELLAGLGLEFSELGSQAMVVPGAVGAPAGVDPQYTVGVGAAGLGLYLALFAPMLWRNRQTGFLNQENLVGSLHFGARVAGEFRRQVKTGARELAPGENLDVSTAVLLAHLSSLFHHVFAAVYMRTEPKYHSKAHVSHLSREDFKSVRPVLPQTVQTFFAQHREQIWTAFASLFHSHVPAEELPERLRAAYRERAQRQNIPYEEPRTELPAVTVGRGVNRRGEWVTATAYDYLMTGLVDWDVNVPQVGVFTRLTVARPDYADGTLLTRLLVGESREVDSSAVTDDDSRLRNYSLIRIANLDYDRALVVPAAERQRRASHWPLRPAAGALFVNQRTNPLAGNIPWVQYLNQVAENAGVPVWLSVGDAIIPDTQRRAFTEQQLQDLETLLSAPQAKPSGILFAFIGYHDRLIELQAKYGFSMVFSPGQATIAPNASGAFHSDRGFRLVTFDKHVDDALGPELNWPTLRRAIDVIGNRAELALNLPAQELASGLAVPADYRDQQGKLWHWTERYGFVQEPDPAGPMDEARLLTAARELVERTDKRAFPPRWTRGDGPSIARLEQYQHDVEPAVAAAGISGAGTPQRMLGALYALYGIVPNTLADVTQFSDADLVAELGGTPMPVTNAGRLIAALAQRPGYVAVFRAPAGDGGVPHVFGLLVDGRSPLRVRLRWLDSRFRQRFDVPLDPSVHSTWEHSISDLLQSEQAGEMGGVLQHALTPILNTLGPPALEQLEPMILQTLGMQTELPVPLGSRRSPTDAAVALLGLADHDWHVATLLSQSTELIGLLDSAVQLDPGQSLAQARVPHTPPGVSAGLLSGAPELPWADSFETDGLPATRFVGKQPASPVIVPPPGAGYVGDVLVVGSLGRHHAVLAFVEAVTRWLGRPLVVVGVGPGTGTAERAVLDVAVERYGLVAGMRPVVVVLAGSDQAAGFDRLDMARVQYVPEAFGEAWEVRGPSGVARRFESGLSDAVFTAAARLADQIGDPVEQRLPAALARWVQADSWVAAQEVFRAHETMLARPETVDTLTKLVAARPDDAWRAALRTIVELELRVAQVPRAERTPVRPTVTELWEAEPVPMGAIDAMFAFDYLTAKGSLASRLLWDGLLLAATLGGRLLAEQAIGLANAADKAGSVAEAVANAMAFTAVVRLLTEGAAAFDAAVELITSDTCVLHPDAKFAWMLRLDRERERRAAIGQPELNPLLDRFADILADCR